MGTQLASDTQLAHGRGCFCPGNKSEQTEWSVQKEQAEDTGATQTTAAKPHVSAYEGPGHLGTRDPLPVYWSFTPRLLAR